jgi:hypothetical protein
MVNLANRHHREVERPLLASQLGVEHPPREPSALRASHSAARKSPKKNHHRQGHNNSAAMCDTGSREKNSGAAFFGFVNVQRPRNYFLG